jgi:N-acetylglucosaminyldiphosphoundecaprenol N-acetyl-beta-D-mannosaminyltransferase
MNEQQPPINLLGVRIDPVTLPQLLAHIEQRIAQRQQTMITYANVYAINLAYEQPWFRDVLNQSTLTFCDGFGVKWGARLLGQHIPQRFTPPDWLDQLAALGSQRGYRFFLLGARPGVAWRAAQQLRAAHPDLRIAGVHHGYFDKTPGSAENDAVVRYINAVQPDILILGFGMPLQEHWLHENWPHLNTRVALTGGALFDYISGEVRRGPRWMTDNGFEWLARLVIEPRRLWQRYLVGNPLFLWRVLRQRMQQNT